MKKVFLFFALFSILNIGNAQNPLSYEYVIQKEGMTAEQIYNSLVVWISTNFTSIDGEYLKDKEYSSITLVGLVSHICVISNAIIVKAAKPNTPIYIDLEATSSVDLQTHQKCIDVMKSMHFKFLNEK